MIRKMIDALSLYECGEILVAVENKIYKARYGEYSTPDFGGALKVAHENLNTSIHALGRYCRLELAHSYPLCKEDRDKLESLGAKVAQIMYLREIYPQLSVSQAKTRVEIWEDTYK